ncbi:t-SNARE coiled-coil homology domain-containing protein [Plasmodiophora brassicae]
MSADVLTSHEAELVACLDHVQAADGQSSIDEAQRIVRLMKAEMRALAGAERAEWQTRISTVEKRLQDVKHASLVGPSRGGGGGGSTRQGTTSSDPSDVLEASANRQRQMVDDARRQLEETEQVGAETLKNLQAQREVIVKAQNNLSAVNRDLDQSNRIMTRMSKWWRG